MSKKILIHSLIFSPDGVSTAYLYNDIALRFQQDGYDVIVLTTTPHFNIIEEQVKKQPIHWKVGGLWKESNFYGIRVIHVPQKKFKSTLLRVIGFAYWHVVSFFIALFIKHIDLILSPSPPLTIGRMNIILAKLKGCKTIYNVQEIYPDILRLKPGFVFNFLHGIELKVYNKSDAVVTIDNIFHDTIVDRFVDKSKLHVIPNFVDVELYNSQNNDLSVLNKEYFPETVSLKLLYAGNIGHAQDWKTLVALAKATLGKKIEYFVIGQGADRDYIEQEKISQVLDNIHLIPYQPRELMPNILAYSDIQFIFMAPEMDQDGFPSKVYTIMACGKPLLVCSGEGTPIVSFLQNIGCAKLVTEKIDFDIRVKQAADWLCSVKQEELSEMGQKGVEIVHKNYTKEIVTKQYVELVNKLLS